MSVQARRTYEQTCAHNGYEQYFYYIDLEDALHVREKETARQRIMSKTHNIKYNDEDDNE